MFKKSIGWLACLCFFLSSCVTPGFNGSVGPGFSSTLVKQVAKDKAETKTKLDVIIPVFDPGLPGKDASDDEENVWPELRQAESTRFAMKLKEALEKTGEFGAVRVTPDATATGDIYLIGKIIQSDGLEVEYNLQVLDITGKRWYAENYDHEVPAKYHDNVRNNGKDPYQPVFTEAATDLIERLKGQDNAQLALLKSVTEMRFAAHFSEEAFKEHLKEENGRYQLVSLPSEDDAMLERIRSVRIRDQLFVDNLQDHYDGFNNKMQDSYAAWQEQSHAEMLALRKKKSEAVGKAILGVLAFGLMIGLAAAGGNSGNAGRSAAANAGAIVAGAGGAALIVDSFRTSEEAEFHRETLEEMGQSINMDLAPQVVEFENKTKELTGDAAQQFAEWRAFLKEIYELEKTPAKQL